MGMTQSWWYVLSNQDGPVPPTFRDIDAEDLARIFLSQSLRTWDPTD